MNKKYYFLSDVHLGSVSHMQQKNQQQLTTLPATKIAKGPIPQHDIERKICRWLDKVKRDAAAIYLLGDIFDYWFEYKNVVPRGFTRFLGKVAEITDAGIPVHFLIGNHDIWVTDYLQKECGMIVHTEALVQDLYGKKFFLAHGDGLGDTSRSFQLLRMIFHNKACRKAFAAIHPRWTVSFGHAWSSNRRSSAAEIPYLGEDKEYQVRFAKAHFKKVPSINFFVFGHRHILLDLLISPSCRTIILGDWISHFSYGVFDGDTFSLELFEE